MGTLVTLDLPADSPVRDLPWVLTIGPLGDDEWDPVVCGPYERPHALALAQAVVADDDLMAVVEPLLPLADAGAIRNEIELARSVTEPSDGDAGDSPPTRHVAVEAPPDATEVRAGFARIAARLTAP